MERTTTTRIYESDSDWLRMEQRKQFTVHGELPSNADLIHALIEQAKERGNGERS